MAERADLECSCQKVGQDMFLRIRLYKILIANEIGPYRRLSTTPSRGEFTSGLTFNSFVNKDLIGEKPAETTLCNIVPGDKAVAIIKFFHQFNL